MNAELEVLLFRKPSLSIDLVWVLGQITRVRLEFLANLSWTLGQFTRSDSGEFRSRPDVPLPNMVQRSKKWVVDEVGNLKTFSQVPRGQTVSRQVP